MNVTEQYRVFDREEAGKLLSIKLQEYHGTAAIVVGIPRGGVVVASKVAEGLGLPLEVLPCRKIKNPADETKSIGSVCLDDVAIQHCDRDLPQDYISHQIALLRRGLRNEWQKYYAERAPRSLRFKTIIVIDDTIRSGDTMIACLKSIIRQEPLRIIVAVPLVSAEGARRIGGIADEVVFIQMKPEARSGDDFCAKFPTIDESNLRPLLADLEYEVEA